MAVDFKAHHTYEASAILATLAIVTLEFLECFKHVLEYFPEWLPEYFQNTSPALAKAHRSQKSSLSARALGQCYAGRKSSSSESALTASSQRAL